MAARIEDLGNGFERFQPRALARNSRAVTRDNFDRLLTWLDPDREQAAQNYEQLRRKLIKLFTCRGCLCPEELADETMDRVTAKIDEIACDYRGDPALYFYGVARNVFREYSKKKQLVALPPQPAKPESDQLQHQCLEQCLEHVLPQNRQLLLEYYQDDGHAKIEHRKEIARRFGFELNALRIRLCRIRSTVGKCVSECVAREHKPAA